MNKTTEIIPDDLPDWAQRAIDEGQFFRIAIEKVAELEKLLEEVTKPTNDQED